MGGRTRKHSSHIVNAKLDTHLDADLIAWLAEQPHGKRSEAIRCLLRDGLRMRQLEGSLGILIREAVQDALRDVERTPQPPLEQEQDGSLEEQFGDRLDDLLNGLR